MAISGPIPADSIVPDWSNGENVGGSFNKKRVTVSDKASATDINELRAIVEGLIGHTHGEYLGEGESDPDALGDMRLSGSGYYVLPGGLTIQWGVVPGKNDTVATASFPTSFSTTCFMMVTSPHDAIGTGNNSHTIGARAISNSQFQITLDSNVDAAWIAIGV